MKRDLVTDVDEVMGKFFATATDDEFWTELEAAGWAEFSKIDIPVLDYHRRATHFRVTAVKMSAPQNSVAFATILSNQAIQGQIVVGGGIYGVGVGVYSLDCPTRTNAANNNELALAA